MEKIPTAKDYFLQKVFPKSFFESRDSVELDYKIDPNKQESVQIMIEFAKMHVEQALKEASENAETDFTYEGNGGEFEDQPIYNHFVKKDSILNSYPLDNIK